MSQPASAEEITELILLILDAYGSIHASGAMITKPLGQTPARWQVMGQLDHNEYTVSQIARRVGNSRQSVQRLANEMAEAGMVEFVKNPDHKRSEKLRLKDKGRTTLRKINRQQKKWASNLAKRMNSKSVEITIEGLRQLITGLVEEEKKGSRSNMA